MMPAFKHHAAVFSTGIVQVIEQDKDGLYDPRLKSFIYWSRHGRPRKSCDQSTLNEHWLDSEQLASIPKSSCSLDTPRVQGPASLSDVAIPSLVHSVSLPESRVLLNGSSILTHKLNCVKTPPDISNTQQTINACKGLPISATAENPLDESLNFKSKKAQMHEGNEVLEVLNEKDMLQLKQQQEPRVVTEKAEAQPSAQLFSENVSENQHATGVCLARSADTADGNVVLALAQVLPAIQEIEKDRKISTDRLESRSLSLLQKRQFFHSHGAQPMAMEQLLSDRDSEDEVDNEITDIEDQRMLNDFIDVTQDEKELMYLWNSFVRRQKVLADGHCPWACEAFSKLHAEKFANHPALRRCLMLLMVKLWNHHLVDGSTIDRCLSVVDSYRGNA